MSTSGKILSGTVWSTICTILGAAYSFFATPILIGYFGNANYGLISLATSLNVCVGLADIGMNTTNVRFLSIWIQEKNWWKVNELFKTSLAIYGMMGILNILVLSVVFVYTKDMFNVSDTQNVTLRHLLLIVIICSMLNWYFSCIEQVIRATENVGWFQKIAIIPKFFLVLVLASTLLFKFSIETFMALTMTVGFITIPLQVRKIRKEIPGISFLPQFNQKIFKEILPYSVNMFSFAIFQFIYFNLRPVLLGVRGEIESVTDYRILDGIVNVVGLFPGLFFGVLLPTASRVVKSGNQEALERIAYDGTKYLSIFLSFVVFGIMTIGHDLLMIYVGKDFEHLTIWLYLWLFLIMGNHTNFISSLMLSQPNLRPLMYNTAFSSLLGLVSCWLLIPYFQVGGTIMSFMFYSMSQLLFYYNYYWRHLFGLSSRRILIHSLMPSTVAGAIVFSICLFVPHTDSYLANIVIFGSLYVLLFLMSLWLIMNKSDWTFVKELVKIKRKDENELAIN